MSRASTKNNLSGLVVCCAIIAACVFYPTQVSNAAKVVTDSISAWMTNSIMSSVNNLSIVQ